MLSTLDVENVFIYVADAVRWDFAPAGVIDRGLDVKTVASGIHSPTSISSIVSGTYLPQHHVAQFTDTLPEDVPNLLQSTSVSTALINSINHVRFEPSESDLIGETLATDTDHPDVLSSIDPSFFVLERGPGGHAPYGDFQGDGWEYFEARGAAPRSTFAREYRSAIAKDTDWFLSRLAILEERGLLDDTLVIYTSDHGELLGEAGMLGHSAPIRPQHVYVPTVFIHPDVDDQTHRPGVLRHVDLVPTVASLLDVDISTPIRPAGRDLTDDELSDHGASFHTTPLNLPFGEHSVGFDSAWSANGGYVVPTTDVTSRLARGLYHLARVPWRAYARRNLGRYLAAQVRGVRTHGAPEQTYHEAQRYLERVKTREAGSRRQGRNAVSEESLRQLGYIE